MTVKVRSNGQSLDDYIREAAVFNSKASDLAEVEPSYYPGVSNGYPPDDIVLNGLVLNVPLWQFRGSKFKSIDPYHHTCTVTGATWGLQGRTFDGIDDYITIPDAPSLYLNKNFTIIWQGKKTAAGNQAVVTKDTPTGNQREWGAWFNGALKAYFEIGGDGTTLTSADTSNTALSLDVFYQLTYMGDGTNLSLFVNGVLDNTPSALPASVFDSTSPIYIGTRAGGELFIGTTGEVLIYNRALSLAEIQQIYLATKWRYQ